MRLISRPPSPASPRRREEARQRPLLQRPMRPNEELGLDNKLQGDQSGKRNIPELGYCLLPLRVL